MCIHERDQIVHDAVITAKEPSSEDTNATADFVIANVNNALWLKNVNASWHYKRHCAEHRLKTKYDLDQVKPSTHRHLLLAAT